MTVPRRLLYLLVPAALLLAGGGGWAAYSRLKGAKACCPAHGTMAAKAAVPSEASVECPYLKSHPEAASAKSLPNTGSAPVEAWLDSGAKKEGGSHDVR